ncbi:MAG: hypothetical protein IPJ65_15345 [Archangiaceae bacterium]|nr:hypothetical protein [Archangiaceae bacterium]
MNPRQDIEAVRSEALGLHKRLIDAARMKYEARHGVVQPGEMLRLVAFDPEFSWLRPLTRLILDIDERLEKETPVTEADAAQVRAEVEQVFGAAQGEQQAPMAMA